MSTGPAVPCLALLRVGVAEPPGSPRTLVRSYRTVSPLPVRPATRRAIGGLLSVALNRQVTPSWLSPAPCPVESRLSSTPCRPKTTGAAATRPAHRHDHRLRTRSHVTGARSPRACSLNAVRRATRPTIGARRAMRVIEPGATYRRHVDLVADAERPRHRRLHRRHVRDDDDVARRRARRRGRRRRPAPARRARRSDSPPPGAKSGRPATAPTCPPGRRRAACRRASRSRARSSARRSRPRPSRAMIAAVSRGSAQRAADDHARRAATARAAAATAAACVRPTRRARGSARPSSSPRAFASVRPWRTTISTGDCPSAEAGRCAGTGRARAGSSRPNRLHAYEQRDRRRRAPARATARLGRARAAGRSPNDVAERRPPEHVGVGPRAVEHEVQEHADREAEPPAPHSRRRRVASITTTSAATDAQSVCSTHGPPVDRRRAAAPPTRASPTGSRAPGSGTPRRPAATDADEPEEQPSSDRSGTRRRPHSAQCAGSSGGRVPDAVDLHRRQRQVAALAAVARRAGRRRCRRARRAASRTRRSRSSGTAATAVVALRARRRELGVDRDLVLGDARRAATTACSSSVGSLARRTSTSVGVERLGLLHQLELLVLELPLPAAERVDLVLQRLQLLRALTVPEYSVLSVCTAFSRTIAISSSSRCWLRAQLVALLPAPRRPACSSARSFDCAVGQLRPLGQVRASVPQLVGGGVELLHGEQIFERAHSVAASVASSSSGGDRRRDGRAGRTGSACGRAASRPSRGGRSSTASSSFPFGSSRNLPAASRDRARRSPPPAGLPSPRP